MGLREKLVRNIHELPMEELSRSPLYRSRMAGVSEGTAATQLGCGYDIVPPGMRSCPYHFHWAQEEMFVILEGEGTLRVAEEHIPVKGGDVLFIPAGPGYPHHLINTGLRDLKYLSISTQQKPEVCEYPDSGKVGVFPPEGGQSLIQRRSESLDYWDGEP